MVCSLPNEDWHTDPVGKTGGGIGTNQYGLKGSSKASTPVKAPQATLLQQIDADVSPAIPQSVQRIVDEFGDFLHEIEFLDHSDLARDGCATMDQLADPKWAQGNCNAASWALAESLFMDEEFDVKTICLKFAKNEHWANVVQVDGQNWVFDYTARQFDASATFPLVMPVEQWRAYINTLTMKLYSDPVLDMEIV